MTESEIRKTISALRAVRFLLKEGLTNEAVSSSYYAMFHMARAMLIVDNASLPKMHSDLIVAFSKCYVKSRQPFQGIGTVFE